MSIPITPGSGQYSVAAEAVGGLQYQRVQVLGQGGGSVLAVNPDGSFNASIVGSPSFTLSSSSILAVPTGSIIAVLQSSSIIARVTGSVVTIPTSNQSVSGTTGASVIGHAPVIIIGGSIAATFTPPANQSVSGTVQVEPLSTDASVIAIQGTTNWIVRSSIAGGIFPISGSVAVGNFPTTQNVSGSVVATQGTSPWVVAPNNSSMVTVSSGSVATVIIGGSIAASFTPPDNQSVSGTVGASVIGHAPVVIIGGSVATATTNSSVMLLNSAAVIGSVATLQGTNPWLISGNIGGSVVSFQGGTQITSLVSTVPSSVIVGASIFGQVPATLIANTIPATSSILVGVTANTNGSVLTTTGYPNAIIQITSGPGASITGALNFEGTVDGTHFVPIQGYNPTTQVISSMATVESNWSFNTTGLQGIRARVSNWTVGSITARAVVSPADARVMGVYSSGGNSSVSGTAGASIIGQLPAGTAPLGSVATLQGTNPWVNTNVGSIITTQIGSVIAVIQGSSVLSVPVGSTIAYLQAPSVVGTYAEDAAHATDSKGLFVLGVRNDTLASVTSADGDYSPMTAGPIGEMIVANAPITKWVQGTASMLTGTPVSGGSVTVIAAQGASIFTYITSGQVTNASANNVFLTISGATSSIIAYLPVPANSGALPLMPNGWKTNANGAFTASISGVASVYLSFQGFISKV